MARVRPLKKASDPAHEMTNAVAVIACTIRALGGDSQTEVGAVIVVGRSLTTLSFPCASFCALSTGRGDSRLTTDRAYAVEESEAGGDVLEEFRDVVLDGGAVVGGCQQVFIVFGEMDAAYGVGVVA